MTNAAFIVAEYNPLHGGHVHHIARTRDELRPDAIVCVMSGHFTQRGSAAIVDKWSRARMALHAGVDLVIGLHPVYSLSSAEGFANGAALTAALLGVGGWLSFGAECPDVTLLLALGRILADEPAQYKSALKASLGGGKSFAEARQKALAEYYCASAGRGSERGEIEAIIRTPNNILALEYIKSLRKCGAPLAPHAVPRSPEYPDAASVRRAILGGGSGLEIQYGGDGRAIISGRDECARGPHIPALPDFTNALLAAEFGLGRGPVPEGAFFYEIIAALRRGGARALLGCRDVGEGLENRIMKSADRAADYDDLIDGAASKRCPKSRIRRILTNLLLGYESDTLEALEINAGPPYLRVLGFNDTGRRLLSGANAGVPAVANFKRAYGAGPRARGFMRLEAAATDIYVTAFRNPAFRAAGQEFIRGPAISGRHNSVTTPQKDGYNE